MCFFNTAGPVRPDKHYAISPLERIEVDELPGLMQTLGYMEKCGAEEGHLVVIDRRTGAEERRGSEVRADAGAVRTRRVEAEVGRTAAAWWSCGRLAHR